METNGWSESLCDSVINYLIVTSLQPHNMERTQVSKKTSCMLAVRFCWLLQQRGANVNGGSLGIWVWSARAILSSYAPKLGLCASKRWGFQSNVSILCNKEW